MLRSTSRRSGGDAARHGAAKALVAGVLALFLFAAAPAVLKAADLSSTYSWQPARIGAGGLVTGFVTHPADASVRYVRTDVGNCYRWDVATSQWLPIKIRTASGGVPSDVAAVPSGGGVESIAIDPANTNVIFMSFALNHSSDVSGTYPNVQGLLLKSTDGGRNFTKMNLGVRTDANGAWRACGERMMVDPRSSSTVFYGSVDSGLWRSTDGGLNWSQLSSGGAPATNANVVGVRCYNTGSSTTIYAIVAAGDVYRSTNGGTNWTNITSGTGLSGGGNFAALGPTGTFFMVQNNSRNVWRYNGSTWASADSQTPSNTQAITVDPNNANRLFALAQNGGLSRSLDGGATWTKIADQTNFANTLGWLPQPIQPGWHGTTGIHFDRGGVVWMVQGNEGVLRFTPSANNTESTSNPPQWTIESKGIEEFVTHDVVLPKGGGDKALVAVEDATGLVVNNPDTFNVKWINLQDQLISNGNSVAFCPNDPNTLAVSSSDINYTGSHGNYSGYSTNGGTSWTRFASHPDTIQTGTIAISRRGNWSAGSDHMVILPNNNQAPYYSTNGGSTWTQSASWPRNADGTFNGYSGYWNLSLKQRQLKADPFVADKYYLKLTYNDLYVSTDGGVTWSDINSTLPVGTHHGDLEVNYLLQNDLWFCDGWEGAYGGSLGGSHGVFHSTNGGSTWTRLTNVDNAIAMALGKGSGIAGDASYCVYLFGKLSGDNTWGIFRSNNGGSSWDRISGYPTGIFDQPTCMGGSWDTYGLVYVGFSGNSFVYGKIIPTPVAAPTFSPAPGTYTSAQTVTISSATTGASIRYTTDGSTPTSSSGTVYSSPVSIAATTTLKAIAYKSGMTDSTVTTGVYTINIPSGQANIAGGTPTIDGAVDAAWSNATSYSLTKTGGTVSSSSDCSASYKAMWDSTALYLLVDVTDDLKKNDSTNPWDDDSVEIYVDGGNNKATSYDANDRQYVFRWSDASTTEAGGRNKTGVTAAKADPTSTTYRLEIKIPWSALGVSAPAAGANIGLDVHVNDDDTGGARQGKKMWNDGTDMAWSNPSLFGTGTLQGGAPITLSATADRDDWAANSGSDPYINTSLYQTAYLKFDLSSAPANITSAKLRLYRSNTDQGTVTFTAYQTTDGWTEATTSGFPAAGTAFSGITSSTIGYIEWDVISYVAAERSGDRIASFAVKASTGGWSGFNSRENAANQPQLVVTGN